MQDIRVAAVVCRCPTGQVGRNLERAFHWTRLAKEKGADVICFPELSISGYSLSPPDDSAQSLHGPIATAVSQLADEQDIVVLAGMLEDRPGGRPCATQLVAVPGSTLGTYRKTHIAPPEKHLLAKGDQLPCFSVRGWTFAIQLCYDAHFPELSTRMALKGAEVIFMPHASPRGKPPGKAESWLRHLPARAFDNGLFVVACNQTGDNGQGLTFPGVAMVIGPDGRLIGQRRQDSEGILLADLKSADLKKVRTHPMRFFLPHRRGDLYG